MKRILTICFLAQCVFAISQNFSNFEVISVGNKYSLEQINLAFNQTNLCGYFKTNDIVQLVLDDSTVIGLKKRADLEHLGIYLDTECFNSKNFQTENEIWSITGSYLICEKKRLNNKF